MPWLVLAQDGDEEEETEQSTQYSNRHRDGCTLGMVFHLSSRQSEGLPVVVRI